MLATQLRDHCHRLTQSLPPVPDQPEFSSLLCELSRGPPLVAPDDVLHLRLDSSKCHFMGHSPKNGRHNCILHSNRLPTTTFCMDCGVYLHSKVCFFVFHNARDLISVMTDPRFRRLNFNWRTWRTRTTSCVPCRKPTGLLSTLCEIFFIFGVWTIYVYQRFCNCSEFPFALKNPDI